MTRRPCLTYNPAMRTFLKTAVLALAVMLTVSAGSLAAQGKGDWKKVTVSSVPPKVMTGYHKLFSHDKIMKAEKSGTGAGVLYRLTIKRKGKPQEVIFDATGHAQ